MSILWTLIFWALVFGVVLNSLAFVLQRFTKNEQKYESFIIEDDDLEEQQ